MVQPLNNPAAALGEAWRQSNPGLQPGEPNGYEGSGLIVGNAQRVVQAGGALTPQLLHPVIVPLQHVFRRLPDDGIFVASQQSPFQFEMGALVVPKGMRFIFAEYRFQIFRLNGAVANDAVPLEDQRLPLEVGYDVNIDQARKSDIQAEVLPINPPVSDRAAFRGTVINAPDVMTPQVTFPTTLQGGVALATVYGAPGGAPSQVTPTQQSVFEEARSAVTGAAAGSALLPQEQRMAGPAGFPFTYEVKSAQAVQLRVTVFGAVQIPIAFFEARIAGYLMPTNSAEQLMRGARPCW
jgi:hypothetical protein